MRPLWQPPENIVRFFREKEIHHCLLPAQIQFPATAAEQIVKHIPLEMGLSEHPAEGLARSNWWSFAGFLPVPPPVFKPLPWRGKL